MMNEDIRELIAVEQGAEEDESYCERCGGVLESEQEERGVCLCEACEEDDRRDAWCRLSTAEREAIIRTAGR